MTPQCIVCGKKEEFFQRICQSCYLESHPIIGKKADLDLVICQRCGLVAFKGHWSKHFIDDLDTSTVHSSLIHLISQEWEFNYKPKTKGILDLSSEMNEEGELMSLNGIISISASPDPFVPLITITENFTIDINWGECSDCRIRLSGVYSSKIQIRVPQEVSLEVLERWGEEIESLSEEFPFSDGKNPLFKIITLKNGLDALFRAKSSAQTVGRLFAKNRGGVLNTTTEFAGFDKSKSKEYPRKQVVSISLPKYGIGDYLQVEDQIYRIEGFYNFNIMCRDVLKDISKKFSIKSFNELNPKIFDDFEEFQVINFEKTENLVQIMNLSNFNNQYVNSQDLQGFSEGEIVWGIIYEGRFLPKGTEFSDQQG
jgi:NMD protein affecting ribosome stability and mRNA decay